jgi:CubicO group peptidase (beta-lactamase class C family)
MLYIRYQEVEVMKKIFVIMSVLLTLIMLSPTLPIQAAELDEANLLQDVSSFIEERREGTASVSLGIFKEGQSLYQTQYGFIDEEKQQKAGPDTIYEWGSVSKVLVWIALMQLEESGQIDLNEDVRNYLPEAFSDKLTYPYSVSFMDIMNLQSGFQEVGRKVEFEASESVPELESLLIESQPRQVFKPGNVTAYNNWTPALAAYAVESVTGQSFSSYVQDHIFRPLGMTHTAAAADWSDNAFVRERRPLSKSYYYTSEDHQSLGPCILYVGLYPAGSCAGTFDDFLTFAMEFTRDKPRFFRKTQTWDNMKESSSLFSDGTPRIHHGLLSIDNAAHLIGHSGNTMGYTSSFWFEPTSRTGYVVMTNEPAETAYNYGFAEYLFGQNTAVAQQNTSDLHGLYTNQRTLHKGMLRFTKYLAGLLPIRSAGEDGVAEIPLAGMTVTYVGNHSYLFDNGNGLAYRVVEKNDGKTLESFTSDYERLPLAELLTSYGLIIVMQLIPLALVISLILRLIRRLRKKETTESLPGLLSHVAATSISLSFIYLWLVTDSYTKIKMSLVATICLLASAFIVVNFAWHLYNKLRYKKQLPVSLIWPMLAPVFVCFFGLYSFRF